MLIHFCKSKLAHIKITQAELYYEGSITVDAKLLDAVGIIEGEKVEVLNINNGSRIETYAIAGPKGSGVVCLNGPAARCGVVGDKLILLSYALVESNKAKKLKTKIVYANDRNQIIKN